MTVQSPLSPSDAPFLAGTIPTGWDRMITVEEADAANLLYPVPPYGPTYNPPGPPDPPPVVQTAQFVRLQNITPGLTTEALIASPEQLALMRVGLIFPLWPIEGVLGIVDDVGVRPVRILAVNGNQVEFNFDSTGLDTTDLALLGVVYTGS